MYSWLRPKVAVPVHGEAMHLAAHADFARSMGVETVLTIHNGIMVRLGPGRAEKVDEIEAGRLYKDGTLIGGPETVGVAERRRLSFSGHAGVLVMLDAKGNVLGDPEVELVGLPLADASGRPLEEAVIGAVFDTLDSLPRPLKRDPDVVREAVRRAVRAAVNEIWGKKPVCTVFVAVL